MKTSRFDESLRTLFTSGYTEDVLIRQGRFGPGAAFLAKPFIHDVLARKVRQLLDG